MTSKLDQQVSILPISKKQFHDLNVQVLATSTDAAGTTRLPERTSQA